MQNSEIALATGPNVDKTMTNMLRLAYDADVNHVSERTTPGCIAA